MEIKTFTVSIPRRQIEKAQELLKYEDLDGFSGSYMAQRMFKEGVAEYFHSEGVFTHIHVDDVDFDSDLQGFDVALTLVKKLPKNIVFKADYVTGCIFEGLYLSMVDFKDESKKLFSTLRLDPNKNKAMLHVFSEQLIKGLKEARDEKQTFNQWLYTCLKAIYPNVDFISKSDSDPISKDEMLRALKTTRMLHISLKKGIAENWIIEGI